MIKFIFLVTVAYVFGSVCSAIIVSRLFELPDPCTQGSKNPGATNVLRLAGKQYAAIVVVGDMLKGLLPLILAQLMGASVLTLGFVALAAVLGHVYPIFFEFKGGKGVATTIGALLGLNVFLGLISAGIWLLVANFSRYSSLASMVTVCAAPLIAIPIMHDVSIFPPLFFITLLVIYKHRDNITQLMDGKESKITFKKSLLNEVMEPDNEEMENAHEPIEGKVASKPKTAKKTTTTATKKKEPAKTTKPKK